MSDDRTYIEEQALRMIDPSLVDKWGDPNKHPETQLSRKQIDSLLHAGREVFVTHLTKDGFPFVTVHVYVLLDGEIWSTSVKGRVKARAYKRDPRCGLCLSAAGLDVAVIDHTQALAVGLNVRALAIRAAARWGLFLRC